MTPLLQFAVPFVTALALLGIFHAVAYLHIQLSEADLAEPDEEDQPQASRP